MQEPNPHRELVMGYVTELRRGVTVLAVLSLLRVPKYGYALVEELAQAQVPVEANTLYPLLRRLEKQGLLDSEWEVGAKPRKYYVITEAGLDVWQQLTQRWQTLNANIGALL